MTAEVFTLAAAPAGGWQGVLKPIAAHYNGKTYWGYVKGTNGDVAVRSYTNASRTTSAETVLAAALDVDNHANPAILVRASDHKIVAYYSAHNGAALYQHVSSSAEDISTFASATNLDGQLGGTAYTYPTVYQLTGMTDDPIYLFVRPVAGGTDQTWSYSVSTDDATTWAALTTLVSLGNGREPYWQVSQTSDTRIDFLVADGHPHTETSTSVYHFYFDNGSFYRSDGTGVSAPLDTADMTLVYDGTGTGYRVGVNDVVLDGDGNPRAAFRVCVADNDVRYYVGQWDGASWTTAELADSGEYTQAGTAFSGGIVFDPSDASVAYASRAVAGTMEIFRYTTLNGTTWTGSALTSGSSDDQFFPHVPRDRADGLLALWQSGSLTDYENWTAGSVGLTAGLRSPPDGLIIPVGSQANVEGGLAPWDDVVFAIDSVGETIGYSTDLSSTWIWPDNGVTTLDALADVTAAAAADGLGLFYDGSQWVPARAPEPLLLEDGSLAVLENGHVAMSEPEFV